MNRPSRSAGPAYSRLLPVDRALGGVFLDRLAGLGCDHHDVAAAGQQALDLLEADLTATDDQAPAAAQLQARDVERRVQHVLDAGLVTEGFPELADARFSGIGLSWHIRKGYGIGQIRPILTGWRLMPAASGPRRLRSSRRWRAGPFPGWWWRSSRGPRRPGRGRSRSAGRLPCGGCRTAVRRSFRCR